VFGIGLRPCLAVLLAAALLGGVPAGAQERVRQEPQGEPEYDLRQARRSFDRARAAEQAGDWLAAFELYSAAVRLWPREPEYWSARERARFQLVQQHVDRADRAALARQFDRARQELLAALALDPEYSIARERLAQLPAPPQPAGREYDLNLIRLRPDSGHHSFNYRGDSHGAFLEVARRFGVTAALDPDITARQIRFRVDDVDFETAMRLLGQQTGTFWRAVDERAVFVVQDTPQKRRDYAPTVERTIYLPSMAGSDRATETLRLTSEIAGIVRAQLDTRTRTLTVRGAPEAVELAAAVLEDLEQALGELILEIEILEIDRTAARRLGVTPPSSGRVVTLSEADAREAQESLEGLLRVILRLFGTPAGLAGLSPQQIAILIGSGQLGQLALIPPLIAFGGGKTIFLATLPGAAAEFSQTFRVVRRGRRMLLRAQDGQPASFFIGERFPITLGRLTTSFLDQLLLPGLRAGDLSAPYPAFQYEDLGLKVRATPRLHPDNEVTLQLEFEIRSRTAEELNGIPVLSNRTLEQSVRLKENETSVVAGILQHTERRGIQGWPGLAAVPVTGARDTEDRETELLIFITPRRIRLAPRVDLQLYAGREPGATGSPNPQ
jgi:general secretion pathway protein D